MGIVDLQTMLFHSTFMEKQIKSFKELKFMAHNSFAAKKTRKHGAHSLRPTAYFILPTIYCLQPTAYNYENPVCPIRNLILQSNENEITPQVNATWEQMFASPSSLTRLHQDREVAI